MVKVELSDRDSVDWALKKFRRKMIRSGLFRDMKRKRYYEKPSEARRRKRRANERRRRRNRRRR
jgi:small subunit ribosomal protein S21